MYGKTSIISSYQVARLVSVRCSSNASKKLLEFLVNMPKANSGRIADAQRQRQHILKKSEKYGPSTVYLQVLGSGARGAPNTLYLFTDQKRYLFNCGESTQRLAHEYKVKLSRLEHIFITNKSWCNIGGLPGLSLTLQDVGVPNLTLHGPEGLDELYNATKRFVIMKDMNVTMAKCSPSEDFSDSVMTVKYVLLGPHDNILMGKEKPAAKKPKLEAAIDKEFEEFSHDETDYYRPEVRHIETSTSGNRYVKDKTKQKVIPDKDPMKKKTEKVLHELQKKTHCSVAYICTLKKRLGTLDLAKCVERGVKPGPMLGQLKNGHDVVLPDGTLVLSKDVKTPDDPGPVFIVLDVPELSYLKEAEFSAHFDNSVNPIENIPSLIVHLSPPHVLHHPTYRTFMGMFGPRTRHLVLNAQNSCLGSEAVHRTQHKLHLLDADIFPLLRDASVPAVWNAHPPVPKTNSPVRLKGLEELKNKIALAQFQNIINMEGPCKGDGHAASGEEDPQGKLDTIAGRTLTMFHLRPKRQLDRSAEPKLHIQEYIEETMDVDGFVGSLEQFRRLVDSMRYAKSDSQREYPKVVFLGTGSCIPSKTRNTSAIVLQIDEKSSMLMDCGEGTFGQLVRFYGPKKVNGFLRTLKAIYISHLHADHHIGLIGVLQARRQALEEGSEPPAPLHLLAPGQIATWLTIYDQQFERIRPDFTLVPNQSLLQEPVSQYPDMTSAVLASLGVQQLRTCYVAHCPNAFGLAVQIDDQHKLTYSGDTIPCEELINIGENSTLLIHEATMEDELWEEARTKMHSTTSQAIEAGRAMRARYTLLTHFSQRYARLPRLNAHILSDNNSVGIAFDNMQITMSDLELLPHMYAPLQLMFAEHCVEMEMKAAQRAKHKERTASPAVQTEPNKSLGYAKSCNSRKSTSPSARASSSAATPHAKYRESNASRLRQEIKGMTITGSLRKPRSKSSSPIKKSAASTPRSEASDVAVRGRTDRSPESLDLIATPRTMSETSDLSRADTLSTKVSTNPSAAYIVDIEGPTLPAHSKTINSVGHSPTGEEVLDIMANANKRSTFGSAPSGRAAFNERNYKAPERPVNSYGKPLVTHLNKKLIIRRDNSNTPAERVSALPKEANNIPTPARYPIKSWRAETNKILPETTQKHDISRTKLPTKGTVSGNKLRGSNTSPNVKPDSKIPVKTPPTNKTLRASTTAIPKTTTNKSPTRPVKTSPVEQKSDKPALSYNGLKRIKNDYQRDAKSWSADTHHSPTRPIPTMKSPYNGVKRPTYDPTKKSSAPLREIINDKLRQPFAKEMPVACVPGVGRQSSTIHSNRSFKPQLEDIKSSYLLLNNKSVNRNVEGVTNNGKGKKPTSLPVITKPEPVNENARREQLNDIKKKFQSRRFWNDSKYDKIEGLNWISWK